MASGPCPFIPVKENEACGGDVEGQPEKGGHQKEGGKGRELQRVGDIEGGQQNDERKADAKGKEDIQEEGGERNDHDEQNRNDPNGQIDVILIHVEPSFCEGKGLIF
jgi:hypothetical protein